MTDDINTQFEEFWRQFPRGRKTAKADARRKFKAIVTGKHRDLRATAEELTAGAIRYAGAMGDNHPYVKMPSTWLNQGCWEDEDLAPPVANSLPAVPGQSRGKSTRQTSIEQDLLDKSWCN